ncbi:MAG: phosphotransferase [Micrococcales bacterium]
MGNTPLILAALTKAAAPALNIVHVGQLFGDSSLKYAIVTDSDGKQYEARMPRSQAALTELELELRALKALDESARARLPFAVSSLVGEAKHSKGLRVFVLGHVPGREVELERTSPSGTLAENIGEVLGAIHNLPASVVVDAHLPEYNPADIALKYVNEMDRIAATGKVPAALLDRWQTALEDVSLFRYQPTVVHGSLDSQTVLQGEVDHAQIVTGITNWSQLHIGDPAEDFAWIFGSGLNELCDVILMSYNTRHPNKDETLRQRAQLYSELAIGRYLLAGVNSGDEGIIEDAVAILATYASDLEEGLLPHLGLVQAPIAPIFDSADLIADPIGAAQDAQLDSIELIEVIDLEAKTEVSGAVVDSGDESGVAESSYESSDETAESFDEHSQSFGSPATEPVGVIEEVEVVESADETEADDAKTAPIEKIDDRTRPIELPAKTDNELF